MEINKDEYVPVVNEEQAKAEVLRYLHSRGIFKGTMRYKSLKKEIENMESMVMEGAMSFDFEQEKIKYKNFNYHETFTIPFRMITGMRKKLDNIDRDKMYTATILMVSIVIDFPAERLEKLDYQIIDDISVIIPFFVIFEIDDELVKLDTNSVIKSVVREHHWSPDVINKMYFDDIDHNGLVFWYKDLIECDKQMKAKYGSE